MYKFDMGTKAVDVVTGFTGTIVGRTDWITGCNTYGLAAPVDKEGKRQELEWVDEVRLEYAPDEAKRDSVSSAS